METVVIAGWAAVSVFVLTVAVGNWLTRRVRPQSPGLQVEQQLPEYVPPPI